MIGNPITLTSNVSSKTITTTAMQGQTNFAVAGGYRINQISVFRNGIKLASDDYQARDGATVTLTVGANAGDTLEFQVFDDFRVANALDVNAGGSVNGSLNVNGNVIATSFIGNVSGSATYATTAGVSTLAQGLTGTPNISVGVSTVTSKLDVTAQSVSSITSVAALNIDCSLGNFFTKSINGNSTFTVSNVPSSRAYSFTLELVHTSGSITWFSGVIWPNGTAPTLTTGKTHLFIFLTDDGGTTWRSSSLINYAS